MTRGPLIAEEKKREERERFAAAADVPALAFILKKNKGSFLGSMDPTFNIHGVFPLNKRLKGSSH